ncbi:nuclease-related domain-containing protein [Neobacillus fumarioli]|uniref:nuclease-related domain-containing protein n=1 Tax=Neobacillus fumarioli TaxID=105229 RepID=UPI00082CF7D0|nr:nuclease-related domain-containing protein [Neobacillus fumarioli]
MLLKERTESNELLALRYLNTRMELSPKEKFHYLNLEKGYEGEVKFDRLAAERLKEERYILNDLLLEVNNSYFQIDSLIISQSVIHLCDIKNLEGDCYLEGDKLFSKLTGREYQNPVNQIKRSGTLFRQLLQNLKLNFLVDVSVIFINPEFTLYQAPMDQPFILPTQLNRFLDDLNKTPSMLHEGHKKVAQNLLSLHQNTNRLTTLPKYTYDQLSKGIYCKNCKSFLVSIRNNVFLCDQCGEHEKIEHAILRNVKEFQLLFPEKKITTQRIYEWCNVDLSKKTFSRVLKKHYTPIGRTSSTYYV